MTEDQPRVTAPLLIDTEKAAKIVDSTVSTLERDRATGNLGIPYVRIGRNVRYLLSDLITWVKQHRVKTRRAKFVNGDRGRP